MALTIANELNTVGACRRADAIENLGSVQRARHAATAPATGASTAHTPPSSRTTCALLDLPWRPRCSGALDSHGERSRRHGRTSRRPCCTASHGIAAAGPIRQAVRPGRKLGHVQLSATISSTPASERGTRRPADGDAVPEPATAPAAPRGRIVMGSDSDWAVMQPRPRWKVRHQLRGRCGLRHRMPDAMISTAGTPTAGDGRDHRRRRRLHLPGMLAAVTPLPVIGVPVPLATSTAWTRCCDRPDARQRAGCCCGHRQRPQRRPARRTNPGRCRSSAPAADGGVPRSARRAAEASAVVRDAAHSVS